MEARQKRFEAQLQRQFGSAMDHADYQAIKTRVRSLQLGHPGAKGVIRSDFTLAMLLSLGRIHESDLEDCYQTFDQLDKGGDGMLSSGDVSQSTVHIPLSFARTVS